MNLQVDRVLSLQRRHHRRVAGVLEDPGGVGGEAGALGQGPGVLLSPGRVCDDVELAGLPAFRLEEQLKRKVITSREDVALIAEFAFIPERR